MESFAAAVEILRSGGPWALVVFLAWAYWQKDKQVQALTLRIVQMVETNAASNVKLETAVNGLKEFIATFIHKDANKGA